MEELIKPRLEVEKEKALENTRKEATEAAITTVKAKIKEQMEAEQAARDAAEGNLHIFLKPGPKPLKKVGNGYFGSNT